MISIKLKIKSSEFLIEFNPDTSSVKIELKIL